MSGALQSLMKIPIGDMIISNAVNCQLTLRSLATARYKPLRRVPLGVPAPSLIHSVTDVLILMPPMVSWERASLSVRGNLHPFIEHFD